jgi:hypothetical protein
VNSRDRFAKELVGGALEGSMEVNHAAPR